MIFVVRHGDTDYVHDNEDCRHMVISNSGDWSLVQDLTESGIRQVEATGQEIAHLILQGANNNDTNNPSASSASIQVISSPMGRCIHTSHEITQQLQQKLPPAWQLLPPLISDNLAETPGFRRELRNHIGELLPHLGCPKETAEPTLLHRWRSNQFPALLEEAGDQLSGTCRGMLQAFEHPSHCRQRMWRVLQIQQKQQKHQQQHHVVLVTHAASAVFAWEAHYYNTTGTISSSDHCFLARGRFLAMKSTAPEAHDNNHQATCGKLPMDDDDKMEVPCPNLVVVHTNEPSFAIMN